MRIEGLHLKNIGVFKDVEMEFPKCPEGQAEIHIFTGVNGSGKSTILKALACGFEEVTKIDIRYSEDQNDLYDYFPFEDEYFANCKIILNSNEEIKIVGRNLIGYQCILLFSLTLGIEPLIIANLQQEYKMKTPSIKP